MKKISIGFLFLLAFVVITSNAFALLTTENCDKEKFLVKTVYEFASNDVAASLTAVDIPAKDPSGVNTVLEYVVPSNARLVGISVSENATKAATSGSATYDVTINGTVTGLQALVSSFATPYLGASGSAGTYLSYSFHDRDSDSMERGFKAPNANSSYRHDADHPYGKATALVAGSRIGVKVTTSSGYAPVSADPLIRVYVVE